MPPEISPPDWPCLCRLLATSRTAVLRLQKMMAVLTFSLWSRPRSTSRFLRGSTGTSHCLIDVLAVAGRLTSIILGLRSEEHTSELQSLMRISYAVFCLKKTNITHIKQHSKFKCPKPTY